MGNSHTKLSAILTDNGSNIVAAFRSDMAVTLHDNEEDESDEEDEDKDYDESDFDKGP